MITAHSGCDRTKDNSLEFLKYALGIEVDAVEVDVRKNRKGELILSHDETQEEAVLLSEAFALMQKHPEKRINCDLKQQHLEDAVVTLASKMRVDKQLIFTGDVDKQLFKKGGVSYPQVLWFANLEVFRPEFSEWVKEKTQEEIREELITVLHEMKKYEAVGLNWEYKLAETVWEEAQRLDIGISVWTVDEEERQKLYLQKAAANITTRKATQMIFVRNKFLVFTD